MTQLPLSIRGRRRATQPVIKWTGGKSGLAEEIGPYFPEAIDRYFEPFLGGGAILYTIGRLGDIASDSYEPLVRLWKLLQDDAESVISDYSEQWRRLQADIPAYYYTVRERFNRSTCSLDLLFLTRTCVNGIIRFNSAGKFNNSYHLSRKGMMPARFERLARQWSQVIQGVTFISCDYEEALIDARDGDFVYLDPPYAGNRQRYAARFDLERFFGVLQDLNRRGVKWALSFDGERDGLDLSHPVDEHLYRRRVLVAGGNSAVGKVLNGQIAAVKESLYLNY